MMNHEIRVAGEIVYMGVTEEMENNGKHKIQTYSNGKKWCFYPLWGLHARFLNGGYLGDGVPETGNWRLLAAKFPRWLCRHMCQCPCDWCGSSDMEELHGCGIFHAFEWWAANANWRWWQGEKKIERNNILQLY